MKVIKLFGHPVMTICLFLVILITGESIGGVYLFYLLLALPHALIHSIFAISGIIILVVSYSSIKKIGSLAKSYMNIAGILLLVLSLFSFFYNDKGHYNYGTFHSIPFWITFSLFAISALSLLSLTVINLKSKNHQNKMNLV